MNKTIGFQLVIYSLLLAGLSCLIYYLAPALARTTLITGLLGGTLCLAWGIRAILGHGGKALPILTLIPTVFVLLSQTVMSWSAGREGLAEHRISTGIITFLFVISIVILMRIAYAGAVFDGQPCNPAKDEGTRPHNTGK